MEHEYYDHRAVPQLEEYLDEQVSVRGFPCTVVGRVAREGRGLRARKGRCVGGLGIGTVGQSPWLFSRGSLRFAIADAVESHAAV